MKGKNNEKNVAEAKISRSVFCFSLLFRNFAANKLI
jgi:hypothetical protein